MLTSGTILSVRTAPPEEVPRGPCLPPDPAVAPRRDALLDGEGLTILASSEATAVPCPLCGQLADRVHSRYTRTLADLPWATLAVRLRVRVRKFFCANAACPRRSSPSGWGGSPRPTPGAPIASGKR